MSEDESSLSPASLTSASAQRTTTLARLKHEEFDLIVVGGGATGLGIALDASLRGLSVAVLDSHDFAKGTSSRATKLDDLMQAGMMGLLDAARRYREMADAQFETYATTRIRGAMLDELRSQDWLPRSVRSKSRQIEAAIHELNHRLLRAPTETEIAEELEISLEQYQVMLEEARGVQILHYEDLARNHDDRSDGADAAITSAQQPALDNPLDRLLSKGLRSALVDAIKSLPEREQLLLSLQFEHDLNQKEISQALGVTEGRVSQLRSQAVSRIRAFLAQSEWDVEPNEGYAEAKLI